MATNVYPDEIATLKIEKDIRATYIFCSDLKPYHKGTEYLGRHKCYLDIVNSRDPVPHPFYAN